MEQARWMDEPLSEWLRTHYPTGDSKSTRLTFTQCYLLNPIPNIKTWRSCQNNTYMAEEQIAKPLQIGKLEVTKKLIGCTSLLLQLYIKN